MFKIIKRTTVYESKWLTLYEELLDCGNNRRELYNKVLTFDTAHIVPIFNDGSLLMVENYRHGVGQQLLELPGGFINPGETPTHAAGRELLEETGYAARVLKEISFHYTWPGRCTQKNHVFRAQGLFKHSSQTLDTLETIKILKLSKRKVFREIEKGMIKSAATISAIFLAYIGDMDKNNYSNKHD